jgi:hypothetical protein
MSDDGTDHDLRPGEQWGETAVTGADTRGEVR